MDSYLTIFSHSIFVFTTQYLSSIALEFDKKNHKEVDIKDYLLSFRAIAGNDR